jgi:hypothetical protein
MAEGGEAAGEGEAGDEAGGELADLELEGRDLEGEAEQRGGDDGAGEGVALALVEEVGEGDEAAHAVAEQEPRDLVGAGLGGGAVDLRADDVAEVVGVDVERLDVAAGAAGLALAAVVGAEGHAAAFGEPSGDATVAGDVLGGAVRDADGELRRALGEPLLDVQADITALDLPRRVFHGGQ